MVDEIENRRLAQRLVRIQEDIILDPNFCPCCGDLMDVCDSQGGCGKEEEED